MEYCRSLFRALGTFSLLCSITSLSTAGCTGRATLKAPFGSFNRAYADTLNEQTLLNLARLHNGHPPYYLLVGTINNKFSFQGSANAGGESSDTSTITRGLTGTDDTNSTLTRGQDGVLGLVSRTVRATVGTTLSTVAGATERNTFGGSISASNSPDFQFIPLNNNEVSKQFLDTIPVTVFYSLFEQGYPLDMLMRVLVERADLSIGDRTLSLVNSPIGGRRVSTEGGETATSYARFLRAADMVRELQLAGYLELSKTSSPSSVIGSTPVAPKAKDLLAASEKNMTYRKNEKDQTWELLGPSGSGTRFQISKENKDDAIRCLQQAPGEIDREAIAQLIALLSPPATPAPAAKKPADKPKEAPAPAAPSKENSSPAALDAAIASEVANVKIAQLERQVEQLKQEQQEKPPEKAPVAVLMSGMVATEGAPNSGDADKQPKAETKYKVKLVMRSYARALEAVATEQINFDKLDLSIVRPQQRQPIIKTVWSSKDNPASTPLMLRYCGNTYKITDPQNPGEEVNPRWNRDVFKLLVALASQVSVDLSKYQRSVIEVR